MKRAILVILALALTAAALVLAVRRRAEPAQAPAPAPSPTAEPALLAPAADAGSLPANWEIRWDVLCGGAVLDGYARPDAIRFSEAADYFALPGVCTFRGDNWRSGATYGAAEVSAQTIAPLWSVPTGSLSVSSGVSDSGSSWTGSGWTGQPLIVQWDAETRRIMNLYPDKQSKDGLVEVIYATLDGHVYFLDLDDGSATRDALNLGMAFKGAGALDPRGYPLLYVGSGDVSPDGSRPRMFVVSLIDGSVLYEYGDADTDALRRDHDDWCAFDSSPLLDAASDTLIWPGENGLLYTIRLNTRYDKAAGTLSVSPDEPVKARYDSARSGEERYWYGMEASAAVAENYLYVSENGGLFFCVDLNSMQLVWAQDTADDSNSTPVFEPGDGGGGALYTAPSLHWTADGNASGSISLYKLDAESGAVLWQRRYDCQTVDGVSGGVQSTPLLGRSGSSLDGLILYSIARCPDTYNGLLVALDTQTGEERWRLAMDNYTWSSPVAVYGTDGTAYVVLCDSAGTVFLLDGASGAVLDSSSVEALVEASPAVYDNTVVVGTRGQKIFALRVS